MEKFLASLVPLFLMINLIVLIHSSGHLTAARALGLGVAEVSFGLGPRLYTWSNDGTSWNLRGIPIGGYVRLAKSESKYAKQILAQLAGPAANATSACLAFYFLFIGYGAPAVIDDSVRLVEQSVLGSMAATIRAAVWTLTTWSTQSSAAFAVLYETPALRIGCSYGNLLLAVRCDQSPAVPETGRVENLGPEALSGIWA